MSYARNAKHRPGAGHRRRRLAFDAAVNARPSSLPSGAKWTQSRCREQAKQRTYVARALAERAQRGLRKMLGLGGRLTETTEQELARLNRQLRGLR